MAFSEIGKTGTPQARSGFEWLKHHQNDDGGWGGSKGTPSTVEETALAVEALVSADPRDESVVRGLKWLMDSVEDGSFTDASPIGLYFARLWYFEKLYPFAFITAALGRALDRLSHV